MYDMSMHDSDMYDISMHNSSVPQNPGFSLSLPITNLYNNHGLTFSNNIEQQLAVFPAHSAALPYSANDNNATVYGIVDYSTNKLVEDIGHIGNVKDTDVSQPQTKRARIDSERTATGAKATVVSEAIASDWPDSSFSNHIFCLLQKTFEGRRILAAYKLDLQNNGETNKFGKFVNKLCRIVIDNEFLEGRHDIHRERFLELQTKVQQLFPKCKELPNSWYQPSVGEKCAKGPLFLAYKKIRASAIECNTFKGTFKEKSKIVIEKENWTADSINDELLQKWSATISLRLKIFQKIKLEDIYTIYPCLKCTEGYKLILQDFDSLYERKSQLLYEKWPETAKAILKLAKSQKNSAVKKLLEDNKGLNDDQQNNLAFFMLPLLMQIPNGSLKAKKGQKIEKNEILEIFITLAEECENLEEEKDFSTVQTAVSCVYEKTYESLVSPYIVVCGKLDNIKSIYVVISNSKYKIDSASEGVHDLSRAFDILYKAVKIFSNDSYKMYKHIIQFFDYQIFGIVTTNVYQSVIKLVRNLNLS